MNEETGRPVEEVEVGGLGRLEEVELEVGGLEEVEVRGLGRLEEVEVEDG